MKDNIVKVMVSGFALMVLVLGVMAVTAVSTVRRSVATSDWVNHTHAVILETRIILSCLNAGEAGLRNYLLTEDRRDQDIYRDRFNEMVEHLEVAKALTRTEPSPHRHVLKIEALAGERIILARELVQTFQQQGKESARRRLQEDVGRASLGEIDSVAKRLIDEQNQRLRERDKSSYLQAQATRWTIWVGLVITFFLLVMVGWLILDDIAARHLATRALQDANAILEQKVQERTAELARSNERLRNENLERQWSGQLLEHQLHYSDLIINAIQDHVIVISKARNISRVNSIVVKTTGFEVQDIVGNRLDKILIVEEPSDTTQLRFSQALKEGRELLDHRGQLLCRNGNVLYTRVNMVPLREKNRVVGGVVTVQLSPEANRQTNNMEPISIR